MPKIDPEIEAFARIKVIGVGGSGLNAVTHMVTQKVRGVEFIGMNTDAQALHHSRAPKRIHIGKNISRGLGTGMNVDLGRKAAEETIEEIQGQIKGADMVFVACGLGGGTGTGAAPVIARTAREQGVLTVGVVTRPFFFEGAERSRIAEEGLAELQKNVDALIVIPNDRLFNIIERETSFTTAFAMCDEILRRAVEGISDIITMPGVINVDFADIKSVMRNAGSALMGIGAATGEKRAEEAAQQAINSPLLDVSIEGARGVLFAIAGGEDMTMFEIQDAAKIITESIDRDARVIFGAIKDDRLKKNQLKVTVIATGFPSGEMSRKSLFDAGERESSFLDSIIEPVSGGNPAPDKNAQNKKEVKPKEKETEKEKKAIYNGITKKNPRKIDIIDESLKAEEKKKKDDGDDWSSIPAFLRRRK